jgi:prefoldin subunit 5
MNQTTREIDKMFNAISNTEISVISTINSTASSHKQELMELNEKSSKLIDKLSASTQIGQQASKEVKNAAITLNNNIQQNFNDFNEYMTHQMDTQKDQFRNWMTTLIKFTSPNNTINELKSIIEKISQERELLNAERLLFKESKKELETMMKSRETMTLTAEDIRTSPVT